MIGWQELIVLAVCSLAGGYVLFRVWRLFSPRKTAGCASGCFGCKTTKTSVESGPLGPLMQIGPNDQQNPIAPGAKKI